MPCLQWQKMQSLPPSRKLAVRSRRPSSSFSLISSFGWRLFSFTAHACSNPLFQNCSEIPHHLCPGSRIYVDGLYILYDIPRKLDRGDGLWAPVTDRIGILYTKMFRKFHVGFNSSFEQYECDTCASFFSKVFLKIGLDWILHPLVPSQVCKAQNRDYLP